MIRSVGHAQQLQNRVDILHIIDRGIVLTGGGALLRGMETYLTRETGVPVYRADNAMIAVAPSTIRH